MRNLKWSICLIFIILTGCAVVQIPLFPSTQPLEEKVLEGKGQAKILLLDISGIISEKKESKGLKKKKKISLVARIKEELQKAEGDSSIAGVIIKINSPGGSVTATDIIYHELMQYKKQAGVKIVACLTGTATSGGYYVASAADEIIAHPTSVTGSIGVIAMKFNVEKFLSQIGIQEETIKSGEKKDIWSPFRPSTPEEKDIIQTIINTFHERFVKVVLAGRQPLLSKEEIERLADGRIFTADQALEVKLIDRVGYLDDVVEEMNADQALEVKLIDRVGYLDDVVEEMKKSLNLKEARLITYNRPGGYKGTIYSGLPAISHQEINLVAINGDGLSTISGVQFMYLWRP
ncbi:MAG: signal peptide peptidase SppA [Deltaproteobacteria bacterium]|nr:signal peptide peptidase SppA [Deltaproteobacteria bacterium]